MYTKLSIARCTLLLLIASTVTAQQKVFDIANYGGIPNGDLTQAVTNAWKEACASEDPSKIVIGKANYTMHAVVLNGPCKAPSIEMVVDGIIKAPMDVAQLQGVDQWIKIQYTNAFTLSGSGTFDGQGGIAWQKNDCSKNFDCKMPTMNFGFNFLNNSFVKGVTSKDSKNFHIIVLGCNNFVFDGIKVIAPADSLNTDGIHIGRSNGVVINNTDISTGDDCISLGDGSKNISVANVNCGPGHGISVGSLGRYSIEEPVDGFTVKNCTLKDTSNGVRIKTWPGTPGTITITNMHFEDIVMNNVSNPVIIDQEYCPWNHCNKETPSKIKISNVVLKNIRGTSATEQGIVLTCSSGVPCESVELHDVSLTFNGTQAKAVCSNVKPTVTGTSPACAAN